MGRGGDPDLKASGEQNRGAEPRRMAVEVLAGDTPSCWGGTACYMRRPSLPQSGVTWMVRDGVVSSVTTIQAVGPSR